MRILRVVFLVLGGFIVLLGAAVALSPARHWPSEMVGQLTTRAAETVARTPPAPVTDLTDIRQLQADFNASAGTPLLVMLLSPT